VNPLTPTLSLRERELGRGSLSLRERLRVRGSESSDSLAPTLYPEGINP